MSDKEISPPSSSDGEERILPTRAELKKLERRIHELEIATKPRKDDRWGKWLRLLVLLVLAIGAGEMIWAVPYSIHKRAELAASRIKADTRLAELQAEMSEPAHAACRAGRTIITFITRE